MSNSHTQALRAEKLMARFIEVAQEKGYTFDMGGELMSSPPGSRLGEIFDIWNQVTKEFEDGQSQTTST